MSKVCVKPSLLSGSLAVPTSKSHSLRAILLASMARGSSRIAGILPSPDIASMIKTCRQLGATIKKDKDTLEITGVAGQPNIPDGVLDAGNSGQVFRFASAMVAMADGSCTMTGDASIRNSRPALPLIDGINQLGGTCASKDGAGRAPLTITGPIKAGEITIDGLDSQPVSAFLMACAFMDGTSIINVKNAGETPWIDLTLGWLDKLNIEVTNNHYIQYIVKGVGVPKGFNYSVPGDLSSISFPLVAALITGSSITIGNVHMNDSQGDKDIIFALQKLGANINIDTKLNTITVLPSSAIKGGELDINNMIDTLPILGVLGCFSRAPLTLKNCAIARKKECDRLACITQELTKMGAHIDEKPDQITIYPSNLTGARVESHHDHRMAMALGVAGLMATGETIVEGADCVEKSYPDFWAEMKKLGANMEAVE